MELPVAGLAGFGVPPPEAPGTLLLGGAGVGSANVRWSDGEGPYEAPGLAGSDGGTLAGLDVIGAGAMAGVAVHDEQPELVLNGAELTPLMPHAPDEHEGV